MNTMIASNFRFSKIKLVLLALFSSYFSWGQVVIASDGFNNSSSFTFTGGAYFTGISSASDSPSNSPFFSEGTGSRGVSNGVAVLTSPNINTFGYTDIEMSLRLAAFSIGSSSNGVDGTDIVLVEVSPDAGVTWFETIEVSGETNSRWSYTGGIANAIDTYDGDNSSSQFFPFSGGTQTTEGYSTITITDLPAVSNLKFRITLDNTAASELWVVDDFKVQGVVACIPPTISSVFPNTGPVGTTVTINASSGNLSGATAKFNGTTATIVSSTALQMVVIVPAGATNGDLEITNTAACPVLTPFTVLKEDVTNCEGTSFASDLIIYEVHDEEENDGGIITIFNGTSVTKDLSNYTIYRSGDANDNKYKEYATISGTIAPGALAVIGYNPTCPPKSSINGTINGGFNGGDGLQLRTKDGITVIDDVDVISSGPGYYMVREPNQLSPKSSFVLSDWSSISLAKKECFPTLGTTPVAAGAGIAPVVTSQPVYTPSCGNASFSVVATDGFPAGNPLAYQWYVLAPNTTTWVVLSNTGVYSGTNTSTLNISSTTGVQEYQYYCQVRENTATCFTASNAVIIKGSGAGGAVISDKTAAICSGSPFTITPTNTLPDVIPSGTTYTWTAPVIAPASAIIGGSVQATAQASISQTLTNTTSVVATATYTVTATSGTCTSTFKITVTVNPNPVLQITNQSIGCGVATVDLTLSAVTAGSTGGGVLSYWTDPAATTALANPNAVGVGVYYIKSTAGTCFDIKSVTVAPVGATIPTPTVITPVEYCQNSTPSALSATALVGATLNWYGTSATGGTASSTAPTPTTTSLVPTTYYVSQTVGGCESARSLITVTINSNPSLKITNQSIGCGVATVDLTLSAVTAGSTGGGVLSYWTDPAATTALANPNAVGVGVYYIKSTAGTCFDIKSVTVASVGATIPTPTIITPVEYCQNSTPSALSATALGGATLNWYGTNQTGGTASSIAPTPTTTALVPTTYYVSQTLGSCESTRVAIVVTVSNSFTGKLVSFQNCESGTDYVFFDWNNPNPDPWLGYNYSYTIDGGTPITGFHVQPSNFRVAVTTPGAMVTFTILSVKGNPCIPPVSLTCNAKCLTNTTPNFAPIQPICSGATAPILDTTSPNGIIGTWSPSVVSNTTNGTYKFTPNPVLFPCALPQTLVVVVNAKVTPTFAPIPTSFCQNAVAPVLRLSSTNSTPITGTWSPAVINTSSLTTTQYTFTPIVTACAIPTSVSITINPNTVTTFAALPSALCQNAIAPVLPTRSTNSPVITGTWSPALVNTSALTTTNYTFTPTAGLCATQSVVTITVNTNVVPTFAPIPSVLCQNAIAPVLPTSSTNSPSISGTWSPAIINTSALTTITPVFTPTPGLCATTKSLSISINPNVVPTFAPIPSTLCQNSIAPILRTSSTNTPAITGTWSPPTISTAALTTTNYTFTPTAGLCAAPTSITVTVEPTVVPSFSPIGPLCSGTVISLPTTSIDNVTGTWSPVFNPLATTTYTFTPTAGQCSRNTTMRITIVSLPIATVTKTSSICSGGTTSITLSSNIVGSTFTWNVVETNVTGATNGASSTIAQTLTTINNDVSGEAVYSITPSFNGCVGLPVLSVVTVNPIPIVSANPPSDTVCSGTATAIALNSPINGTTFSWTVSATGSTGASNGTGSSIMQTLKTVSLLQGTVNYTITPSAKGCAGVSILVPVTVNPTPDVSFTGKDICSGEFTDIVLTSSNSGATFSWKAIQTDATGALNGSGIAINQILEAGTVVGKVEYTITPSLNDCDGIGKSITIKVNPLPTPLLTNGVICIEQPSGELISSYILNTGLSTSQYSFKWFLDTIEITTPNSQLSTYEAILDGNYSVIATRKSTGCISSPSFAIVDKNFPAEDFTTVVSDYFSANATVTVNVQGGTGPYLYQIDLEEFQTSKVFSGVRGGTHTITIKDPQGCTILSKDVIVIDYPKYFTPNGDRVNDTWNISGLSDQAEIFIYDRYGKLIKQVFTTDGGWDGKLNGFELPATDYWFTVDYKENNIKKLFKAHFSLKR